MMGESLKRNSDYQNLKNVDNQVQALFEKFDLRSHDANHRQQQQQQVKYLIGKKIVCLNNSRSKF